MKERIIAIYDENNETLHTIVNTIEQASNWLNVTRDALYKSLKLNGVMKAREYTIELVEIETLKGFIEDLDDFEYYEDLKEFQNTWKALYDNDDFEDYENLECLIYDLSKLHKIIKLEKGFFIQWY